MARPAMANEHQIGRLLAGKNRLGRLEKEAVLDAVLPRRSSHKLRWIAIAMPALAAAALLLLWLVPRKHEDAFSARGGGGSVAAFAPTCNGACTRGGKLLFDLHGTTGYRAFAAFAKAPDASVIWYVDGRELAHALDRGVLAEAIELGADLPAGCYRVFGVFSDRALSRDEIRALFDDEGRARAAPGVAVIDKELEIR